MSHIAVKSRPNCVVFVENFVHRIADGLQNSSQSRRQERRAHSSKSFLSRFKAMLSIPSTLASSLARFCDSS